MAVLNSGIIPPNFNHTFIMLIPKIQSLRQVTDFKPISLCKVLYKLIAKVLANRQKKFLPELISETQSAFMAGRLITDNILIAHKTLHYLKTKRTGKMGLMVVKLDMSKAYVAWSVCSLKKSWRKWGSAEDGYRSFLCASNLFHIRSY